jgi:hypothetical protein
MIVIYEYPNYRGIHYASWSIDGYTRPENQLCVVTDRGQLLLTGSLGAFVQEDGNAEIVHHLDFVPSGDVLADISGGGLSAELEEFRRAIRTGTPPLMSLQQAETIEHLIHAAYRSEPDPKSFCFDDESVRVLSERGHQGAPSLGVDPQPTTSSKALQLVLDLRDYGPNEVRASTRMVGVLDRWDRLLVMPQAVPDLPGVLQSSDRVWVTAPDFLTQSRKITAGGARALLQSMSLRGVAYATLTTLPSLLRDRSVTFWSGVRGLLSAALESIPQSFRGTILLHGYVTDLALALGRIDILRDLLVLVRKRRPGAKLGFHTNLAREVANAVSSLLDHVEIVSMLSSPGAADVPAAMKLIRQEANSVIVSAEVGPAPVVIHRLAVNTPYRWAHTADALVVVAHADDAVAQLCHKAFVQRWRRAFPGFSCPGGLL